jgi:cytochrome c oxidase assembly factor CtaG
LKSGGARLSLALTGCERISCANASRDADTGFPIAGTMQRPYEWNFHLTTWVALLFAVTLVVLGHRRLQHASDHPIRWTRHEITFFGAACCGSLVALTWPVADLAAHWSLTALVVQRLVLLLGVAPMLLLGLPYDLLEWITRPALVDAALNRARRPATAIGFVTVLTVASMIPPVVQAQSSSSIVRGLLAVTTVVAGLVLWIPVLGRVPGIPRLRPMARFGYLAAQAVVPAFLSFVLILSPHPLYAAFAGSKVAIDLRPLNDQQIAGFVSKLTMLIVLLTVGAIGLVNAPNSEEEVSLDESLVWADVQRQFERAERRTSRGRTAATAAIGRPGTPLGKGDSFRDPPGPSADPATPDIPSGDVPERDRPES